MRNNHALIAILLLLMPLSALADQKTMTCGELEGARIDFFKVNQSGIENNKFIFGRDKIGGIKPVVKYDIEKKEIEIVLGDESLTTDNEDETKKINVIQYDEKQISVSGMVYGAPMLITYYPVYKIMMFSQQATWPGVKYDGARAMLLHSSCSASEKKTAPTQPAPVQPAPAQPVSAQPKAS